MNSNTILYRFGLDPENYVNQDLEPITFSNGFIYEVNQRTDIRVCPHCGSINCYINNYFYTETSCKQNEHIDDILRIKKVRFKCKDCGATFTPPVSGIERRKHFTSQVESMIYEEFFKPYSFSDISNRFGITKARVLQIFDSTFKYVPRKTLPKVLCIDEKRFSNDSEYKYCCILYDFQTREIVDVIKSRQLPFLDEYFSEIPEKERNNVQYFISDMYDGYASVCQKYFPKATHIVDLFHVVRLICQTVNSMRIKAMKAASKNSKEYRFMKKNWKLFIMRSEDVPDKTYTTNKKMEYHYDDMINRCIRTDKDFLDIYNILQDFYHYNLKRNYKEAEEFVEYMTDRLDNTDIESAKATAKTFRRWKAGISTSISSSQNKKHYSNSVAEGLNNHIENLIRVAYGYHNFERFRKRILLIRTYKS